MYIHIWHNIEPMYLQSCKHWADFYIFKELILNLQSITTKTNNKPFYPIHLSFVYLLFCQ